MDQAQRLRNMIPGERTSPLRIIAVTSGKGGVGKTNISANLSVLAARAGKRVLVIDADLGLANVEILLGLSPRHHVGDLIDRAVPLESVLTTGPHGICVLPAGSGVQTLTNLNDDQKLRLIAALDPLEDRFDLVIVDTGAGIGDNVLFFVGAAQEALLLVSPEPTSLTDAYATVKVLSQQVGVRHFNVVVNPAPHELAAREIYRKLTRVTDRFLDANVRYLGYLPHDDNLHRSVMAQKPLVELYPHTPATRSLVALSERLLEEPPQQQFEGGLRLLWQRLFRERGAAGV
jgi:flagellar biosynthesis protein FlhG